MTRSEFRQMDLEDLLEWASENLEDVITEDMLKDFAIHSIEIGDIGLALHIVKAIYLNTWDTIYYRYDRFMGSFQKPIPIRTRKELESLIDFEEE